MQIYEAKNTITNEIYIGATENTMKDRMSSHKYKAKNHIDRESKLYESMRAYGFNSFDWKVLTECQNVNELDCWEKYYIWKYKAELNITTGGKRGYTCSNTYNHNRNKAYSGKGIHFTSDGRRKAWRVYISKDGETIYNAFETEEEAIECRQQMLKKYFPQK